GGAMPRLRGVVVNPHDRRNVKLNQLQHLIAETGQEVRGPHQVRAEVLDGDSAPGPLLNRFHYPLEGSVAELPLLHVTRDRPRPSVVGDSRTHRAAPLAAG